MGERVKLLLDEHIWEGLVFILQNQGYDVLHINHTDKRGIDDEPLLDYAASQGRAVLTNNHKDFVPLIRGWFLAEREHASVILSIQLPRGELLRQTEKMLAKLSAEELRNTVRWLQEF